MISPIAPASSVHCSFSTLSCLRPAFVPEVFRLSVVVGYAPLRLDSSLFLQAEESRVEQAFADAQYLFDSCSLRSGMPQSCISAPFRASTNPVFCRVRSPVLL